MAETLNLVSPEAMAGACARAQALFRALALDLAEALPEGAAIEHVGATAIPDCLTKGDLDLAIRVEARDFETCRWVLAGRFAPNPGSVSTASFCAFADESSDPPVGIQLVVRGSELDVFTNFRDRLRSDPDHVRAYNALKLRHAGGPMERYRDAKAAFIAGILRSGP